VTAEYPVYMNPSQFQEYMHEYATHFDLIKDIQFNTSVKCVTRKASDTHWQVETECDGKAATLDFDKVALCHGYQTKAKVPTFEGQEKFTGTLIHSQQYRQYV
jgi:dimethylaniline monooxygenase (N-oxide forming)